MERQSIWQKKETGGNFLGERKTRASIGEREKKEKFEREEQRAPTVLCSFVHMNSFLFIQNSILRGGTIVALSYLQTFISFFFLNLSTEVWPNSFIARLA